jgi:hypothetical protein
MSPVRLSTPFGRTLRRVRYGRPVVVVSGLPRSGTSLMMQMLEAGGMEIVSDGFRGADDGNLRGYYELERVKTLEYGEDPSWLTEARGKAVKIIAFLLKHLPESLNYSIVFMHRNLDEVLDSQAKLLALRGETSDTDDASMRQLFERHLAGTRRMLEARPCFEVLDIDFNETLADATRQADRVNRFLGGCLDTRRMAGVVRPELYRSRR